MVSTKKSIDELEAAHTLLAEFEYELRPVERGYANRTLYIDLSENAIKTKPVTQQMKDLFTGGKGFALWLLWQGIEDNIKWNDPKNEIVIGNGPICGITSYPGTGKSTVVTVSPLTKSVIDSNAGGYFGPYLKFAGFDALEIQGKAEEDVLIFIDGDTGKVTIETAPLEDLDSHLIGAQLTEMYSKDEKGKRGVSVVSAGQSAEYSAYGMLNLSWYDTRRKEVRVKQAGRGGSGRVFRDKNIKAIVVRYSSVRGDSNNPADMDLIRKAGKRINAEIVKFDDEQNQIRKVGTPYLVEIMDHFDLLPTKNFQYGSHPDAHKIDSTVWKDKFTQGLPDGCWLGCTMSCSHGVDHFPLQTGPYAGDPVLVDGPEYETAAGLGSNIGNFDPIALIEMNFYCDTYAIDTISFADSVAFAMECYEAGEIDKEDTGGLELVWGNADAVLEILHQLARGEGFGLIVGQGVRYMKKYFVEEFGANAEFLQDIGMEVKGMEVSEYITKESLAQQGGYALANKGAQHDEAWLIFQDFVHNQIPTFEDKAEALYFFPIFRTWFSLHGLCKLPWNDITPEGNDETDAPNKFPEHIENYTWLVEGMTGKSVTEADLVFASEKVYNLQRIMALRLGFGTREHDYPPYRAVGPVTVAEYESRAERYDQQLEELVGIDPSGLDTEEKVARLRAHRESEYEKLVDAVYPRRGWDENGIPTLAKLEELGLDLPEIVDVVERARS
ncbi:MAG: aldehyde ferredoxin oxidoreductase C-terminal domain-containing protein [Chloroflexota bacterium]|nr:aldehyde ferredoxin oxidoreductase C-terminal domain-containing protein [Chloroflexota bacterium]